MSQDHNRLQGNTHIRPHLLVILILLLGAIAPPAAALGRPVTAPTALLWSTVEDNWATFQSYRTPEGSVNLEATDDFDVVASVDRIVALGFTWGTYQATGIYVRFYAANFDGTPGAQQAEYYLAAGDPNFVVFNYAGSASFDVTLSPPFNASGRHFVSVQPVSTADWNWWNADHNAPRGETVYTRSNGGAWSHPIDFTTGQPYASDVAFSLYGTVIGAPHIDHLSAITLARSGYLEIFGNNFDGDGQVSIAGLEAPVANWTDGRIVVYVPEATPLGVVPVQVTTAAGASNTVNLEVTTRQANGRITWRLRMDAPYSLVRPVFGPDGTIYQVDVYGHLYALSPDGGLKWLVRGAGNKGVAVGQDGTIYVGSEPYVKAFNPDGTERWTFVQDPRAFILLGLSVGPDGNIYGVASSGMGVFSLTPQGTLRWQVPEPYDRLIVDYGEIVFGPSSHGIQMYFYANRRIRALTLNGQETFTAGMGQPAVSPLNGSVHNASTAYDPDNGSVRWTFPFPAPNNGLTAPDIGPDGVHYVVQNISRLWAINPDGSEKWHVQQDQNVSGPIVDPQNTMVVMAEYHTGNELGYIRAVDLASRALLWRVELAPEDGYNQFIFTRARFAADGNTAYLVTGTATGSNDTSRSFLNAIATRDTRAAVCYDFNGNGQIDAGDLTEVGSRWLLTAANPDPDNDPSTPNYEARFDLVPDGVIDLRDIETENSHFGQMQTCA